MIHELMLVVFAQLPERFARRLLTINLPLSRKVYYPFSQLAFRALFPIEAWRFVFFAVALRTALKPQLNRNLTRSVYPSLFRYLRLYVLQHRHKSV